MLNHENIEFENENLFLCTAKVSRKQVAGKSISIHRKCQPQTSGMKGDWQGEGQVEMRSHYISTTQKQASL